jgi:phospholipid/cholesterol/gamma-HCH transport system permease protein
MSRVSDQQADEIYLRVSGATVHCGGRWKVEQLARLESALPTVQWPKAKEIVFDMSAVTALDTAGALLIERIARQLEQQGKAVSIKNLTGEARSLFELVRRTDADIVPLPAPAGPGLLERIGRGTVARTRESVGFLGFIGETALVTLPLLVRPGRIRWRLVVAELADAGHKALPIVGMLAFIIGIVIGYQGGVQLRHYGAGIYIADVVGKSVLRELAPLITAIIVAGRTGSAYTAQIGTMRVTEEIDALRTIGIPPLEQLVLPKLLALIVALPLLTVYADVVGILGGMVMAHNMLGVNATTFIDRLQTALSLNDYLVGVGKAPVFAAIIAAVGCYQGLRVSGSAESVGRHTTVSVVESIFLVITIDGAFSVVYNWLGL